MSAVPITKYTANEYLAMEDKSPEKHEFYQGEIFAMAGASIQHNQIVRNCSTTIDVYLSKTNGCQIFPSDLKIHIPINSLFTYPDLSIVCGDIETLQGHRDIVTNPSVLIEVLSASTKDYDRGSKFQLYRDVSALQEYIMISSLEILVEKFTRQDDGSWILHIYKEDDTFTIETIGMQVDVKSFYRNVVLEAN